MDIDTPMELLINVDCTENLYSSTLALALEIESEALADKRNHCGGRDVVSRRAFNSGGFRRGKGGANAPPFGGE